jgi:prepilin-type N-terminal cleavage/methylation domain-containing protein
VPGGAWARFGTVGLPERAGLRPGAGFTLVELMVVLILMGLATALVAPSLLPGPTDPDASLQRVLADAQAAAIRRGEPVLLEVGVRGEWTARGASSSAADEVLGSGGLVEAWVPPHPYTLRIAPTGSCGMELAADTTGWRPPVDLLTCRVVS